MQPVFCHGLLDLKGIPRFLERSGRLETTDDGASGRVYASPPSDTRMEPARRRHVRAVAHSETLASWTGGSDKLNHPTSQRCIACGCLWQRTASSQLRSPSATMSLQSRKQAVDGWASSQARLWPSPSEIRRTEASGRCLSIPAMKEKVMAVSCTTSWWLGFGSGGTSGYGSPPSRVLALSASIKKRVGSALERLQAAKFGSSSRGPTTRYRRRARRTRASVDVRPTTNRRHSSPEEHGDDHF